MGPFLPSIGTGWSGLALNAAVPTFIGEGIPLIAPRHREVPLRLRSVQRFPDGVVQLHYAVKHLSSTSSDQRVIDIQRKGFGTGMATLALLTRHTAFAALTQLILR